MDTLIPSGLSRRERQIMEVVYARAKATAAEVLEGIPDPPSYSAVRALMAVLVEKGFLKFERVGRKYVYEPTVAPKRAKRAALKSLMQTFFEGSPEKLVASLLNPQEQNLSDSEIGRIRALIAEEEEKAEAIARSGNSEEGGGA